MVVWAVVLVVSSCLVYAFYENFGKFKKYNQTGSITANANENPLATNDSEEDNAGITDAFFPVDMVFEQDPKTQSCKTMKFIVYAWTEGEEFGEWGDTQTGIIAAYLLATYMNRTFVILPDGSCDLSQFLVPNKYNWMICQDYILSMSKTNTQTVDIFHNAEEYKHFVEYPTSAEFNQTQAIFIRTNQLWDDLILANLNLEENYKKWTEGKTAMEFSKLVLHKLFKPTDLIQDEIKDFMNSVLQSRKLICGDVFGDKNPSESLARSIGPRLSAIRTIVKFLKAFDNPAKYALFIASSFEKILNHFDGLFLNSLTSHLPTDQLTNSLDQDCKRLGRQILEQMVLIECNTLLLTDNNLGKMSAYMSEKVERLFYYLDEAETVIRITREEIPFYHSMARRNFGDDVMKQ